MHPIPSHPSLLHFQGCLSSQHPSSQDSFSPHRSPRACPGLSAPGHSCWALNAANPLSSYSSSPFSTSVQDPGLYVWRVEKMKPVPVAPENQGIFFSGDSYLVLYNGTEEFSHLHLWIGEDLQSRGVGLLGWRESHRPGPAHSHRPRPAVLTG